MAHAHAGILGQGALKSTGVEIGCEVTDRHLLTRYVGQKDETAFVGLLERHARMVWRVCRRVLSHDQDTEDAFQAVFLVLAQSAASIRNSDAVGSWLHGVAYRTAMQARRRSLRLRAGEQAAAAPKPEPSPSSQAACLELQRHLDEELQRLAEIYRAPFILCCLEGMSKSEAARELNCKQGTISGRLARARKLLQKRLARRGITLASVLTAAALIPNTGSAAVPAALVQATASGVLAKEPGAGLAPSVRALAENVLREPALTRKLLGVLVLACVLFLLGGASLAVSFLPGRNETARMVIEPDTFLAPGVPLGTPVDEQVAAVAFSPDGRRLVTAGGRSQHPGQIKIWDAKNAKELTAVSKIPGVRTVAFSPDGKTFATGDASGHLTLRDAETADVLASVPAHPGGVHGLAFSREGSLLATGGADGVVRIWSGAKLKQVRQWRGHADKITAVAFFHHDQAIATASEDKSCKIWDVQTGDAKVTLEGHQAALEAVAVAPDDRLVAATGRDGTVRVWDAANGAVRHVLSVPGKGEKAAGGTMFYPLAFSPDGALLAGAGLGGVVQLWDTKTFQPAGTLEKHAAPIWALAFSRQGVLASGSADRTVKLWHLSGTKPATDLTTSWSGARPILAAAYAPDGAVLAVATTDKTIHIREAKSGDVLMVLPGHTDQVTCLAFSPNGKTLASGSKDRTVKLWDRAAGEIQHTLTGHTEAVQSLTFIPGGPRLASAGADGTIHFWDADAGKEQAVLHAHAAPIAALACAPDGQILASGGADRAIKLWDLTGGEPRPAQRAPFNSDAAIRVLAFSESGMLASASDDGAVRLWNLDQATPTHMLDGHVGPVIALAFTPKGRTLVSGGQDQSVRVWGSATGEPRGVLSGHKDIVTALAIHPHGHDLVSGSLDTRLLRWQAGTMRAREVHADLDPRPVQIAAKGDRAENAVAFQNVPPGQPPEDGEKDKDAKKDAKKDADKNDKPQLPGDLYEDFRGARTPSPVFRMMNVNAGATVKPEAGGLRITIPAKQERRHRVGIEMRTPVKGNFEIAAGYEILAADQPVEGYGIGFEVYVNTATPTLDRLGLFRLNRPLEGESYMVSRGKTVDGKAAYKNTCTPTTARSGQLKLTRRGTQVTAWSAEGAAGPFREIQQTELGAADVNRLWFAAYVGNTSHGVDLRIVDVKVRGDLPDDDAALAPVAVPALGPAVDVPAHAPGRPRVSLILVGLLGLSLAATLLLGVVIVVVRRRWSQ